MRWIRSTLPTSLIRDRSRARHDPSHGPSSDGRRRRRDLPAACAVLVMLALVLPSTAASAGPDAMSGGAGGERGDHVRVGYFTQWSVYSGFTPKRLDDSGAARNLSHIHYAFGNISADGECFIVNEPGVGDAWADYQRPFGADESVDGQADTADQALAGNFNQLRELKEKYPNLKMHIALGGWVWSQYFSDAALTAESRRNFVSSCVDLYIKGNLPQDGGRGGPGAAAGLFDGIDVNWEWPNWPGAPDTVFRPEDRENFTALLAEFRTQLDEAGAKAGRHYALTTFLPANSGTMDAGYEGEKIFDHLDYATYQGYDLHGTWEAVTNHQSAIREPKNAPTSPDFTIDRTTKEWLERGAPAEKLVLGVPYYGRGWTGVEPANRGLFQPAEGPAPSTVEPGYENYHQLAALGGEGFQLHRDVRSGFAWLFDGETFWTIDDPLVVAQKMLYVRRNGLGGAMVWSLDGDDDRASLTRTIGRFLR